MKRLFVVFAALIALAAPSAASAHPLGNFTVNRFAAVELSGRDVFVHYVLDLAEIPTVQEGDSVRATGFDAEVARRLDLELDGRRAELVPVKHKVSERPGAGGLPTLRFEAVYRVTDPGDSSSLVFHDTNFAGGSAGGRSSSELLTGRASSHPTSRPRARATSFAPTRGTCCARRSMSPPPAHGSSSGPAREPRLLSRARLHPSGRRGRSSRWLNGEPRSRRSPPVASHRRVLGRRPCAEPRAREGDGRRVPRRLARDSAARALARPDRDRDAHGRRLRARDS